MAYRRRTKGPVAAAANYKARKATIALSSNEMGD